MYADRMLLNPLPLLGCGRCCHSATLGGVRGKVRAAQRGLRELELDPRARAVVAEHVRYQGPGPSGRRRVHRRLQHPPAPQQLRDAGAHRLRTAPRRAGSRNRQPGPSSLNTGLDPGVTTPPVQGCNPNQKPSTISGEAQPPPVVVCEVGSGQDGRGASRLGACGWSALAGLPGWGGWVHWLCRLVSASLADTCER